MSFKFSDIPLFIFGIFHYIFHIISSIFLLIFEGIFSNKRKKSVFGEKYSIYNNPGKTPFRRSQFWGLSNDSGNSSKSPPRNRVVVDEMSKLESLRSKRSVNNPSNPLPSLIFPHSYSNPSTSKHYPPQKYSVYESTPLKESNIRKKYPTMNSIMVNRRKPNIDRYGYRSKDLDEEDLDSFLLRNRYFQKPKSPKKDTIMLEDGSISSRSKEINEMLKALKSLGYSISKTYIDYDGNCQFSSVSDQLSGFGGTRHGPVIRKEVISWLRKHKNTKFPNGVRIKDHVFDEDFDHFCCRMSRDGEWGNELTLRAICEIYDVNMEIVSTGIFTKSKKPATRESSTALMNTRKVLEMIPMKGRSNQTIYLGFYSKLYHYVSIVPRTIGFASQRKRVSNFPKNLLDEQELGNFDEDEFEIFD